MSAKSATIACRLASPGVSGIRCVPRRALPCGEDKKLILQRGLMYLRITTRGHFAVLRAVRRAILDFAVRVSVSYRGCAEVAQLVEQRTENPRVASSILALGTILLLE